MGISAKDPLITFGIMAYNDARFIREALDAAFAQTYQPLEIIVSDDCSTDQTHQIIKQMVREYRGPHTVVLNRNERNLGISRHINRIMELCSGEIMVIAAADDISLPHRVQRTYDAFLASGGHAFSIHSSCILINASGERMRKAQEFESYETDLEGVIEEGTWLYGCTHAWRREIFDNFGPLPADVTREDEVLPFRALLLGTIGYIREPLVLYRMHQNNVSRWNRRKARDRRELNDLVCSHTRERVVNLRSYLADLEKAGELVPLERRLALQARIVREIESREVDLTLRKGTVREKVAMLRQQNGKGFDPVLTARVLLRILFPDACQRYSYRNHSKTASSEIEALPQCEATRRIVPVQE